jgi:aryl-phospho-beta-D-glucosidase BglC (GH1 family)
MELNSIQDIERAINALPAHELAKLYAWLDQHRPSVLPNTESSGGQASAVSEAERHHIWDVIAENMKDVPHEDFAALPKDGLSQIDHYVYGVPKRTP